MDISLLGLGAVLSQRDKHGKSSWLPMPVIAFTQMNAQCVVSFAKLEMLGLMWVVMEKLRDYLLGSKFKMYTDNNLLAYVWESSLLWAHIR